ncbi:MAG: transposase [Nitrososphaerota archaeon]|nr:transposase [Nitrososphaerota archaeon]MDG6909675.1 transposase [Nitrososphaerota archaeon]MDG6913229.1 transposase [Nitrososphaerota archaeon]MDG6937521.1 transposase [Nitrososphaerota archaeon]MDG6961663.1 transposase [Nitrososphaerota archaeon]
MARGTVDYKSPMAALYPTPRGTSSRCPACGGRLEHPAWAVSRRVKCGVDYGRDRLASLAILCRGLTPFAASADASWQQMRDEHLHPGGTPGAVRAGGTDAASAPNLDVHT